MLRDWQAHFSGSRAAVLHGSVGTKVQGRPQISDWFQRWRGFIRRWIASNEGVHSAEVDDLTQEVFVRLLRYSNDVLVENPQGYLFRVAFNVVQEWRERCRVRMPHDDAGLEELRLDAAEEPENVCVRAASIARVRAVIDQLPTRQRELLWLHVNDEMTYKQIAQARGLTYRIVLRDLTRAYATLREQLLSPASPSDRTSARDPGLDHRPQRAGHRWPASIEDVSRASSIDREH